MDTRERSGTDEAADAAREGGRTTTVDVRCTGHVRTEVGEKRLEFSFEGDTPGSSSTRSSPSTTSGTC